MTFKEYGCPMSTGTASREYYPKGPRPVHAIVSPELEATGFAAGRYFKLA